MVLQRNHSHVTQVLDLDRDQTFKDFGEIRTVMRISGQHLADQSVERPKAFTPDTNAEEYTLGSTRPMFCWVELGGSNSLAGRNHTASANEFGCRMIRFRLLATWRPNVSWMDIEPTSQAMYFRWEH